MQVLIAIPALNEEATLGSVIGGLPRSLPNADVGVLVVDDGSTDRTAEIARESGASLLRHRRNLGLGEAFNTAVAWLVPLMRNIVEVTALSGCCCTSTSDWLILLGSLYINEVT